MRSRLESVERHRGDTVTNTVFRSGRRRATAVKWLFVTSIVAQLSYLISLLAQIWLLRRGAADPEVADIATSIYFCSSLIAVLYVVAYMAAALAFLMWLYRVRANLPALGIEDARWGPGWAVGWWFVPIMNFVAPFMVVRDVWKASGPEARADTWQSLPTPAPLWWWWGLWLIGGWGVYIALGLSLQQPQTIADSVNALIADGIGTVLVALCTVLAIMIVAGVDRRQAERHQALTGAG